MPLERYRGWKHKTKNVGCVFARLMAGWAAKDPARYGHSAEVVNGNVPANLATEIDSRVATAVAAPALHGLALVLPEVTALPDLVAIALELEQKAQWQVSRSKVTGTPIGDVVAFHIARHVPFAGATCPSEALVLGPFPDAFPNTRCAPVTALEIYVGNPPPYDFRGKPTTKAHLALIDLGLTPDMAARMTDETKSLRLESLGGIDDPRAKAKVAFSIPMALASSLGCVP